MNLKNLLFASVIVLSANASFAQDSKIASHLVTISIPEVALLDLEAPSTAITLAGTLPLNAEAGLPMTFGAAATNATIWMNYSSIVKKDKLRNVSVAITNGDVPTGLKLTVLASAASTADGAGTKGTALTTAHTLTSTATSLISGIGSTYTGDGVNKGRNLTYKLDYATDAATDYASLNFDTVLPITITYTLSDSL
jgi:hypothetical protein